MKKIKLFGVLFFFFVSVKSFSQNDCVDAIIICGNADLSNLETTGFGIQEISSLNACSSNENNSIWLKIKIKTGGTLGFIIAPENNDLNVDFDFWVFGPNTDCSNLGTAVRCSTTNPLDASLSYNTTGMNNIETEVSEGPGPNGNSFIKWMIVNDNETYYIAIDRFFGASNFSIAWTGTATFYEPPVAENTVALHACENTTLPNNAAFDLTVNASNAIGNQTNVDATFYTSYSDAVTLNSPILSPNSFQNTSNPQKIYIRLSNNATGCFVVADFDLIVDPLLIPILDFSYRTPVCRDGINLSPNRTQGFANGGIFTATPQGLAIDETTGDINLLNSPPGIFRVNYTIPLNNQNCYVSENSDFTIEIENCEIPKGISPNNDQKNDFFNIEHFDVKELSIFNRYGVKVYHKANYKKEWNGLTDDGKELPDATYYYLIELNNGEKKTGWVYLIHERH